MDGQDDRWLRESIAAIRSDLLAIKQQVEAIAEQRQAKGESAEPEPPRSTIGPELRLPPAIEGYYQSEQNERPSKARWNRFTHGWQIVGLIGIFITVLIYREQWLAMLDSLEQTQISLREVRRSLLLAERQTKAAEVASIAAQGQLSAMQRQFRLDQRPYIIATFAETQLQSGMPVTVNIRFSNVGKSYALGVRVHRHLVLGANDEAAGRQIRVEPKDPPTTQSLAPGAPAAFATAVSVRDTYAIETGPISRSRDLVNWNGTDVVIVFGRVTYRDTFGTPYCTPFLQEPLNGEAWGEISRITATNLKIGDLCPPGTDSR